MRALLDARSPIVRAYAAYALALLGDRASAGELLRRARRARNPRVRVDFAMAAYRLGRREALERALTVLASRDFTDAVMARNVVRDAPIAGADRAAVRRALRDAERRHALD